MDPAVLGQQDSYEVCGVLCCVVQGYEELRAVLPRREDLSGDRGVLIVAYASHKKKSYSFFLLQVSHQLVSATIMMAVPLFC